MRKNGVTIFLRIKSFSKSFLLVSLVTSSIREGKTSNPSLKKNDDH